MPVGVKVTEYDVNSFRVAPLVKLVITVSTEVVFEPPHVISSVRVLVDGALAGELKTASGPVELVSS